MWPLAGDTVLVTNGVYDGIRGLITPTTDTTAPILTISWNKA